MKARLTRTAFLILVGILMVKGWNALVGSALAACGPAPCVDSVTPSSVNNVSDSTITVKGDFSTITNPIVRIGNNSLTTTKVDNNTLTAIIPAGTPGAVNGRKYELSILDDTNNPITITNGPFIVKVLEPAPTEAPTSTPLPTAYVRPLVVVLNYGPSSSPIAPGQTFDIEVNFINTGQLNATNVVITFFPGDFEPRTTGGLRSQGTLVPGGTTKIIQTLTAKKDLETGLGLLDIEIRYTDDFGTAYTDKARIALDVKAPSSAGGPAATRTPTPGPSNRPQFVISGYRTDVDVLKPGTIFNLQIDVQNKGTAPAKGVSMIVGGGSASGGGSSGTPEAGGGVSGGSGEFTNFAPINSSNVQFLGDVPVGGNLQAHQALIVNSTTQPGAYSLKISFVYNDDQGAPYTDDQVITLLVLKPPRVDLSFYRPPDPLFVGQPGILPLQVANLGNASVILGTMTVTAEGADMTNNTLLIGNVDPGFPITLDAQAIPMQPGTLTVNVTVEYTDDFNNQQTIVKTLTVEVLDTPIIEPGTEEPGGPDGGPIIEPTAPETLWDMIVRFFRGLLGLGSERAQPGGTEAPVVPGGEEPPPDGGGNQPGVPIPLKPGKGL